ncbi:MAG: YidC/Oxa1 family membrane protein insertase [Roseburia sp.]|nr:YidC/Oxa1 family membrane protein insertase [Roseburia sp.]
MAFLNSIISFIGAEAITPDVTAPGKMWHLLILNVFDFISDYGWRIVVFTVLLKLILSPFDIFQRFKMNKNRKITERLKPTMEKLQKQYGNDKQAFAQKQMELNRKEGYSYFSACLPMIITMVVFITLWLSMNTVAQYMTLKEYTTLYDGYESAYSQIYDPIDPQNPTAEETARGEIAEKVGQEVVFEMYYNGISQDFVAELKTEYSLSDDFALESTEKAQSSFLWIKNIWAPDVPWGDHAILSYSAFVKAIDKYKNSSRNGLDSEVIDRFLNEAVYNRVMYKLLNESDANRTNGYLILPILVVLLSVGSQLLSMYQQKRAGQVNANGGAAVSMKVMMFVMPVMMAVFAIQYASIFALYMVVNSATSLLINVLSGAVIKLIDNAKRKRTYGISAGSTRTVTYKQSPIIHYVKGANPNAGARETQSVEANADAGGAKAKKAKKSATITVQRSGRPDPNELMNYGSGADRTDKKK